MNIKHFFKKTLLIFFTLTLFISGCGSINNDGSTLSTLGTVPIPTTQSTVATQITSVTTVGIPETPKKQVAFTFDDGPHNVHTKAIVDELDKYNAHATFFVVGNRVDGSAYRGGSTMLYAIQCGNEIGIHGYTHNVHYNTCTTEEYLFEIGSTATAIQNYSIDYETKLMRPIGGSITAERVSSSEYAVIIWDVDSEDWKHKYTSSDTIEEREAKVNAIVENVMSEIEDGSIVLMHDIYESSYDAFVILIERLYAEGYEIVTVSELLDNPEPGKKYSHK